MKKTLLFLFALQLFISSCSPLRHSIHVEMRYPSKSGMELLGKNIAVVQLENDNSQANSFAEGMADGLAYSLEQEYGTGEGSVGIYKMRVTPGGDYSSRDTLINLVIDTGSDLVFLIDTVEMGELKMGGPSSISAVISPDSSYLSTGTLPFKMKLHCYDAMNPEDKVSSFSGGSTAVPYAYSDGKQSASVIRERAIASLPELGFEAGKTVSASFKSQWRHEQYSILYYESQPWYDALNYAEQYAWKNAMEIWIELLDTKDMMKRSCAAYNLSVASYMSGDYDLAEEWLKRSDEDNKLPLSDAMHKRINERKK